jgi:hypothetical protein
VGRRRALPGHVLALLARRLSNLPVYAGLGIVAALGAGLFVWSTRAETPAPAEPVVAAPAPTESEKDPSAEEAEAKPATKQVAIAVSPLSARVFSGEEDLGQSPVMVEVGQEPIQLSVRLDGYVTRELSIDGSRDKVTIELEKVEAPKPAARPVAAPVPRPVAKPKPKPIGGGELVDPWD